MLPMVGCPAIGSSSPGVKIRMRTSVPAVSGGSTNVVSEKFISFAIACMVSVGESPAVEDDGELVAAEEMVGEDVVVKVAV